MSAQGPSNPFGNRPRMAEALASLKEGLRDSADPLYDGWKLRPPSSEPVHAQRPAASAPHPPPTPRGDAIADAGETIDIVLEPTPPETPLAHAEPSVPSLPGSPDDGLPTEEVLIEVTDGDEAPAIERSRGPSVQTDTVRVRIIAYKPFPQWALVLAAALLVFAVSLVALRARFPREATRSKRSVLASQVAATVPASSADRAAFPALNPAAAAVRAVSTPAPSGARRPLSTTAEAPSPSSAAVVEPPSAAPAPTDPPAGIAPAQPPAGKVPSSSPRRRPGSHDFFRDPGF